MIETWLAQKAVRIAILVAALLCPIALVGCGVETLKLHGISIPAPSGFPLYGPWELAHGAIADKEAAERVRDAALHDRDLALHDRDVARGNAGRLESGLLTCNESVTRLQTTAQAWQDRAARAARDADAARRRSADRARAAVARIRSSDEVCPVADEILRASLQ